MASKIGAQAREAFVIIDRRSLPMGVHLGVEFTTDHAVTQINQARAGIFSRFL